MTAASTSSLVTSSPFFFDSFRVRTSSPCAAAAALAASTSDAVPAVAVSDAESAKEDAGRATLGAKSATARPRARWDATPNRVVVAVEVIFVLEDEDAVKTRAPPLTRGARRSALVSACLRPIVSPPTATTVIERTSGDVVKRACRETTAPCGMIELFALRDKTLKISAFLTDARTCAGS